MSFKTRLKGYLPIFSIINGKDGIVVYVLGQSYYFPI